MTITYRKEIAKISNSDTNNRNIQTYLSIETRSLFWWIIFTISSNVSSADVFHGNILDIETNIIARGCLSEGLVVHFHRLAFGCDIGRSKRDDCAWFQYSSLYPTHWDCSNT